MYLFQAVLRFGMDSASCFVALRRYMSLTTKKGYMTNSGNSVLHCLISVITYLAVFCSQVGYVRIPTSVHAWKVAPGNKRNCGPWAYTQCVTGDFSSLVKKWLSSESVARTLVGREARYCESCLILHVIPYIRFCLITWFSSFINSTNVFTASDLPTFYSYYALLTHCDLASN